MIALPKIVCIFNALTTTLTEGKIYQVERELPNHYIILGDKARFIKVSKDRFKLA